MKPKKQKRQYQSLSNVYDICLANAKQDKLHNLDMSMELKSTEKCLEES